MTRAVGSLARWLLVAAAVAAATAAFAPRARAPTLRILLHDASASCGGGEPRAEELEELARGLGRDDRVAVVAFGADARLVAPPRPVGDATGPLGGRVDPHGSSAAAALREAALLATDAARARGERVEVLLATDARLTDGRDALERAATALKGVCSSFRVLARTARSLAPVVRELRGPGAARVGETIALEAVGDAGAAAAEVELVLEGRVLERRSVARGGAFRIAFARVADAADAAEFIARVAGGSAPAARARVHVAAPGRAMILGESPRDVPGLDGSWRAAADAPPSAEEFAAHDLVVIDDLPASALDPMAESLARAARSGAGLLLLGGPRSFGAGGWAGRPIEELSPLRSRPLDGEGTFLYAALDGSGSMGEPWDTTAGSPTRDEVVRAAARSLVASAAADTTIAIRRFAGALVPADAGPHLATLDAAGRAAAVAAIDAMAPPSGSTALLPPLREAVALASQRPEPRKAVLVLTDGRTLESAADLRAALSALVAAGVRTTVVVPQGRLGGPESSALSDAVAGLPVAVRTADEARALASVFRDVEESARVEEAIVEDRALVAAEGSALLGPAALPARAARIDRTWLAEGARAAVATDRGEPVAAVRGVGLGKVAALATRPGDAAWLAGDDRAAALVRALASAAMRPARARVRVERDGPRLLVRTDAASSSAFLAPSGEASRRVPLVAAGNGLFAAEPPADFAHWVDVLGADGAPFASAGVDSPAPAEYLDPPPADLDVVAALACAGEDPRGGERSPWLAALAAALAVGGVLAGRVKSGDARAR